MEKIIIVSNYTVELTSDESANVIYSLIKKELSTETKVIIDFNGVLGITTYCAKNIFGKLYFEMTSEGFSKKISFKNLSKDNQIIIQQGILDFIRTRSNPTTQP